jgi:tRNA A-37 threonylcarbamoyl transferase component Bud32
VTGSRDQIESLVRQHADAGCRVEAGPVWLRVLPPAFLRPAHGWKLHVSSRAATFQELIGVLVPLLLDEGCAFKLARSAAVLSRLNDGHSFPATVGKAVTIYPDQRRVADLGHALALALRGCQGPRVLSDRRVSESAPVYYRYGPFVSGWEADERGRLRNVMHGPADESFEALATLTYRQPPWAADPFRPTAAPPVGIRTADASQERDACGTGLLGRRYRVVSGVRESATGNVYRAVDEHHDSSVVIKQAHALVAEDSDGVDVRLRLRNERRVLQVLDGIAGTPRCLDHFRHDDDEFLVTSDCGERALVDDVTKRGPYNSRSLARLARELARTLTAIHERGVIMRDLSPKNVVVNAGTFCIIDFGIAAYDGLYLPGRTPGYAPARQVRGDPPERIDDLYALGMTLLFAATGLEPVRDADDLELPRVRALQMIRSRFGATPTGVVAAVPDLLSGDAGCAGAAAARLASASGYRARPTVLPAFLPAILPELPRFGPEQAAEIVRSLVADVVAQARRILDGCAGPLAEHDCCLYTGTAGIGRELLQHADDPAVAGLLPELVAHTARTARRMRLPPGLFTGSTGVALFLAEAGKAGAAADLAAWPTGWEAPDDDLIAGAAGVGIGSLLLHRATGAAQWLDVAGRCAGTVRAHDKPPSRRDPTAVGLAHGLAGNVEFLLSYASSTGDDLALTAAVDRTRQLTGLLPDLIRRAVRPSAPGLTTSWCRGLAGIGRTLLHASAVLGEPDLAGDAEQAAEACIRCLPRLRILGQCCGAAGVGEFLIDLATATRQERYLAAAHNVAVHMLLRGSGPPGHPVFTEQGPDGSNATWATGLTGILSFFRRLAIGLPPEP